MPPQLRKARGRLKNMLTRLLPRRDRLEAKCILKGQSDNVEPMKTVKTQGEEIKALRALFRTKLVQ
jgi:hypothetical protein